MTHTELVKLGVGWLKKQRGYSFSCPIVITELSTTAREIPDILGFSQIHTVLIECKISVADFKADFKKRHRNGNSPKLGTYRFYLCPKEMIKIDDIPPDWGLLYCCGNEITIEKQPLPHNYNETRTEEYHILYSLLRRRRYKRSTIYKVKNR